MLTGVAETVLWSACWLTASTKALTLCRRLWLWSEKDGAGQPNAYRSLEDAVAGLGGGDQQRWSALVAVHRRAAVQGGARPTQTSNQDLHSVTLSEAPEQVYLVAR